MKIIDFLDPDAKLQRRIVAIEQHLDRLQSEVHPMITIRTMTWLKSKSLPAVERHKILCDISGTYDLAAIYYEAALQERIKLVFRDGGFASFTNLPLELRQTIWRYAMEFELHPRVHALIACGNAKFTSNQRLSPLLGINSESREYFLTHTKSEFAWGSYISFDRDIIYLGDFQSRDAWCESLGAEGGNMLHADAGDYPSGEDQIGDQSFLDFLKDPTSAKIQTLAMRHDFFKDIPLISHHNQSHPHMRLRLPCWTKTYLIFEDYRTKSETWDDVGASLEIMSTRQRMKRAERGYARWFTKILNEIVWMKGIEVEDMEFPLCFVVSGEIEEKCEWPGGFT